MIHPADIRLRPTGRIASFDICRVIWRGVDVGVIEVDYALHLVCPEVGMAEAVALIEAISAHKRLRLLAGVRQPGDKSQAICEDCGRLVSTTFAHRDVPLDDGSDVVRDVLAAVCDRCGSVVALPAQSTAAVVAAKLPR